MKFVFLAAFALFTFASIETTFPGSNSAPIHTVNASCSYDEDKGAVVCCEPMQGGGNFCWYK